MPKKKKISEFKKYRIKNFLLDLIPLEKTKYTEEEFSIDNLYNKMYSESSNNKHFRNIGLFDFFPTYDNMQDILVISCILSNTIEKKDSIEINEQIVNVIDFLEKVFIYIDKIEINKYNDFTGNKHYILIKCLKQQSLENIIKTIEIG
jgi:hypothetical protein